MIYKGYMSHLGIILTVVDTVAFLDHNPFWNLLKECPVTLVS